MASSTGDRSIAVTRRRKSQTAGPGYHCVSRWNATARRRLSDGARAAVKVVGLQSTCLLVMPPRSPGGAQKGRRREVTREEVRKGKTDCLPGCTTRKRVEGTNHSGRRFSNRKRLMCRSVAEKTTLWHLAMRASRRLARDAGHSSGVGPESDGDAQSGGHLVESRRGDVLPRGQERSRV